MLVFDVVNATTIEGLGIRPTDSFASLLLFILTLLLFSSGCPVVSCGVLRYLDRPGCDGATATISVKPKNRPGRGT